MIQLRHPAVVVYLPDPEFGNTREKQHEINKKYAINGTRYSYVKRSQFQRVLYQLVLTRQKALELELFIELYHADKMTLVAHMSPHICDPVDEFVQYYGNILNNPFEFRQESVGNCGDTVSVSLEFEGVRI